MATRAKFSARAPPSEFVTACILPRRLPHPPIPTPPRRFAPPPFLRSRANARVVSLGSNRSRISRCARTSSIRFSTSPRHSRPVARSGYAFGSAPPLGLAFSAPGKSLGLLRVAGAGARRRRASEAVTASALRTICPPHPWDSCTESPALNARLSPRAWGARAPGPERAARSLGRSRYALALLGQGRSAPSASLNGRRKRASADAPALISPSACGRLGHPGHLLSSACPFYPKCAKLKVLPLTLRPPSRPT